MKVLTVKQPWAGLIVQGLKDIENRTWKTNYRGLLFIHAGASKFDEKLGSYFTNDQSIALGHEEFQFASCQQYSAIIGSVWVVDCVQNHPSLWAEKGVWNWVLEFPTMLKEPWKMPGKLGLWNWDLTQPMT